MATHTHVRRFEDADDLFDRTPSEKERRAQRDADVETVPASKKAKRAKSAKGDE